MKAFASGLLLACLLFMQSAQAQYKSPRQYFPKNNPAPPAGSGASPAGPNSNGRQQPAKTDQPKFKDVAVNSGFYFISDTNRTYLWTKTSTTQAKNTINGVVQTINAETPIQR